MNTIRNPAKALAGVRVVEFGDGVAVAYCGALLRACGATVTKVEPPTGDSIRRLPPVSKNAPQREASGMHAFLDAGKSSLVLDVQEPAGATRARELAVAADVVLDGLGPGQAEAAGFGHRAVQAANPAVTFVALSWFGATGARARWRGTDAVAQALAGFLYPIGPKDGPPIIPGGYNAQITGGLTAFIATMASLLGRHAGDAGAYIDQSILEAQTTYTETSGVRAAYDGARSIRKGLNQFTPTYPQTIYPAADGWIGVTVLTPAQWRACCELIGAPELIDDPRFRTPGDRDANADALDPLLIPLFQRRPALEWFHDAQARRVPFALVPTMEDMLALDHFVERQVLATFEHPDLGRFTAAAIPWKLAASPLARGGVAPRLGEHTDEATTRAGEPSPFTASLPPAGHPSARPLRNLRIVDLTMGWSGPLATRHLADMGAEVIKIEACKYPDWWRGWEHTAATVATSEHEKSPAFNQINRNKQGVAIDLTSEQGQALALRLIEQADAVIENQATGVMDKLGLSFDTLKAVNPSIILLSLPAFGAVGPWSGYRGYGSTVEHGAGLPHLTGDDGGPPVQTHVAYGDACGGLNAAAAIQVALLHRERTGEGQRVELSQVECIMQLGVHGTVSQGLTGEPPRRTGNRHPTYVPHGCFPCAAEDTWLVVALTDDTKWGKFCEIIERPDLSADLALATCQGRREREADIEAALASWLASQEADAAMEAFQNGGIAAGAVRRASDLVEEPGYIERGYWASVDRPIVGRKPHPLTAWRYNGSRAEIRAPAPLLGEHNAEVFRRVLGLSSEEFDSLVADGVIGDTPLVASTR